MPEERFNLFFALLPDQGAAMKIERLAATLKRVHRLSGRPITADRFHVSLYTLGRYAHKPPEIIDAAGKAAAAISAKPFAVTFDRAESFRGREKRHPLVLSCGDSVAPLRAFHKDLGVALKKAGLGRFVSAGFTPHITLLYGDSIIEGEHPVVPVSWNVREFTLVWSHYGKLRYEFPGDWPLRGAASNNSD